MHRNDDDGQDPSVQIRYLITAFDFCQRTENKPIIKQHKQEVIMYKRRKTPVDPKKDAATICRLSNLQGMLLLEHSTARNDMSDIFCTQRMNGND